MQLEPKKPRRSGPKHRWLLPVLLLAAVAILLLAGRLLRHTPEDGPLTPPAPDLTLYTHDPANVTALTITRRDESPWQVLRGEDGRFVLQGERGYPLSEAVTAKLANAACILTCEELISEDPAEYADHLADYGLDAPTYTAVIAFADGTSVTLQIGNQAAHTNAWRYMTLDGDNRLFGLGRGTVEDLFVSEASLREVEQPTIHKARIDRITLTGPDGQVRAEWTLTAPITATDAIDRWQLTAPFAYPADATAMENLLSNAANLRLGTWYAPAAPDALTACGFDAPRLTITLHMAEGTIATTGMDGAVATETWPESTCTFVIGGAESDLIDYVRYGDAIYRCSHFSLSVFLGMDPAATMSRYLLPVALGNLDSLVIETDGMTDVYRVTRTEQVAENNDLILGADGNPIYDVTVTRNGAPLDYARFEAAWQPLVTATVSGVLPQDMRVPTSPHTTLTFTDTDGTLHTVALSPFDALHDTVSINGHEAFYLIKGGFELKID